MGRVRQGNVIKQFGTKVIYPQNVSIMCKKEDILIVVKDIIRLLSKAVISDHELDNF